MHNASNYFFKSVPHRLKHVPFMYQLRAIALIFICFFPLLLEEDASAGEDVPVDGGRVVLGTIGEPSNLNPYISTDSASHDVADLLFIAPIRYNKNLELEPFACKSWAMSEDGLRLTLHMNQGIRWEDGEELTADDVVFTARMAADPKVGSPYAEDFLHIASITAPDRYTVEVVYSSYYARALETFTSAILPKHILEGKDVRASDFSRRPVGAGPYRLKSWESGSRLTLVASPTYFQGRPHIDEVIYRVIPDSGTMFMEARSGRIDLMGLSPEQYLCQTNTPWWEKNFHKYRYLASVYVYLGFNMDHPFFKDVRVRRAISMAISREDLVKGALLGQGVPAIGPYKPGTAFFHPTLKPVKQNVTEARRLLREAGFEDRDGDGILEKDGKPFAFTILTNQGNSERILVSIIIQNQLRRVGIDVRVRTVEWAAFIREFVNKGLFDALVLGWTVTPDPDIYQVWHSSQAVPGGLNFMHFRNKELDSLLEEGRVTRDQKRRYEIYCRVQEILDREQPYCFLYYPYSLPVVRSRFRGIEPALAGISWNMDKWWIPKDLQNEVLVP